VTSDRIEVTWVEDARAEKRAQIWWLRNALKPDGWLARQIWLFTQGSLMGAGAVTLAFLANRAAGYPFDTSATTLTAILLLLAANQGWCAFARRRIAAAQRRVDGGPITYEFDHLGLRLCDGYRDMRLDWPYIALAENTRDGLFLASRGSVFSLPARCWPDEVTRNREADQVVDWWRSAKERVG